MLEEIPVKIRGKALEEIRNIMTNKGIDHRYALRIGVKSAGCGVMGYLLGFDQPKESDMKFEVGGLPVLIDKKHTMYVIGMEIDFYEGADAKGFTFVNPQGEDV